MSAPYLGEIRMLGFNFAPVGWHFCDGSLLSIAQNSALFALLGTTYGGNGVNTFGLPDFRSRIPIHQGQGNGLSNYVIGQVAGGENVTLLSNQIPAHNHILSAATTGGRTTTPGSNAYLGSGESDIFNKDTTASMVALSPQAVANAGGSQPHSNLQPITCVNFCIALQGIFPSRN